MSNRLKLIEGYRLTLVRPKASVIGWYHLRILPKYPVDGASVVWGVVACPGLGALTGVMLGLGVVVPVFAGGERDAFPLLGKSLLRAAEEPRTSGTVDVFAACAGGDAVLPTCGIAGARVCGTVAGWLCEAVEGGLRDGSAELRFSDDSPIAVRVACGVSSPEFLRGDGVVVPTAGECKDGF